MKRYLVGVFLIGPLGVAASPAGEEQPAEQSAAERGRAALLGRSFGPPVVTPKGYDNLWKQWDVAEKPKDYQRAMMERYGLHPAPYDNGGLPMGLREATSLFGKGVGLDCLLCHGGRVAGQSYVGLGNASLDLQGLFDEFAAAERLKNPLPYRAGNVRGTSEAAASTVYLLQFRDADLNLQKPIALGFRDDLCEDVPAWWLLKKKKTMYHAGSSDARAVRPLMAFLLSPLNTGDYIKQQEPVFRDVQAYLLTLEAPKYPFPVDQKLAERGKGLFVQNCAKCHGTYGPDGSYPNKVVPVETVGTDPGLLTGIPEKSADYFNQSWFGQEKDKDGKPLYAVNTKGYQAPPLDGVWATAPYFHNGSAPTLYHVLNSKARPKAFTRSYGTDKEDYDQDKVGHKITVLDGHPDPKLPARERRKVYDTTQPGRGNGGHTFGDPLTEEERRAVLEYLKTL